jgi:hypothetical protein
MDYADVVSTAALALSALVIISQWRKDRWDRPIVSVISDVGYSNREGAPGPAWKLESTVSNDGERATTITDLMWQIRPRGAPDDAQLFLEAPESSTSVRVEPHDIWRSSLDVPMDDFSMNLAYCRPVVSYMQRPSQLGLLLKRPARRIEKKGPWSLLEAPEEWISTKEEL